VSSVLTIVIADDHPIFRRGLVEVIESDPGLRLVGQAGNGPEALRLIGTLRPAVVVLDLQMPGLTGLQVARKLAENGGGPGIVLLTMHEDEELLNEALNLGISAYVLKETAVEELLGAIHAVAGGRTFVSSKLTNLLLRRSRRGAELLQQKPALDDLTPAEIRILKLIAEDRTSKEIAEILGSALRTVETHRQNISAKLKLSGSHSLLKFAYDNKFKFDCLAVNEVAQADRSPNQRGK
jgi:DNA-binding NarL/FixJ family response regulator